MTERASTLPSHPGEVAFPGGKKEEQDENLMQTALRGLQKKYLWTQML